MFVLGQVIPRRKPQVLAHSLPLLSGDEEAHAVPVIPSQVAHNSTLRHKALYDPRGPPLFLGFDRLVTGRHPGTASGASNS
jgi:hypothetical protein